MKPWRVQVRHVLLSVAAWCTDTASLFGYDEPKEIPDPGTPVTIPKEAQDMVTRPFGPQQPLTPQPPPKPPLKGSLRARKGV